MKTITINIPNMQSTHCKTKVKNAVIAIEGVYIQNLAAGTLKASIAYEETQHEVEEAIKKRVIPWCMKLPRPWQARRQQVQRAAMNNLT